MDPEESLPISISSTEASDMDSIDEDVLRRKVDQIHEDVLRRDVDRIDEAILYRVKPGQDGRELVSDTTAYPYSSFGRIIMYFEEGIFTGSGTLISSKYVLTAAHVLFNYKYKDKGQPLSIVFIPGLNGENHHPYGVIKVKRYFFPFEYKDHPTEDYAIIELEEEIGESTGFMEMKMLTVNQIDELEISLYGYPSHMKEEKNFNLYGMKGKAILKEGNRLVYDLDADKGQNGACIYYYSPEDSKYYTIGVHSERYNTHNEAVFLTPERIEQIQKWMDNKALDTVNNLQALTNEVYGRDIEMLRLRNSMRLDKEKSVIALYGVKGVGKSSIALKFAYEAIGGYHFIWVIDSTDKDTFMDSFTALADELNIGGSDDQEKIERTKAFINSSGSRFLFIFDNLQDENLAKSFIMTKGHYIITTTNGNIEYDKIEVGSLSKEASVQLLSTKLPNKTAEEIESLATFLQGHPLALYHSADFILIRFSEVSDFIQNFSKVVKVTHKLKNIVSDSISSLSEESQYILKIVCLGDCDNIPYDILYKVYSNSYPHTTKEDFNQHLSEITRLSILTYDSVKGIYKIFRVIKEAATIQLSISAENELIQHYSDYLYNNYKPQTDTYRKEVIDLIKNLTLQAGEFLTHYKNKNLSKRDILHYSRLAISYYHFFNDEGSTRRYLEIIEKILKNRIQLDEDLVQVYANLEVLYYTLNDDSKCIEFRNKIPLEYQSVLAFTYNSIGKLYYFNANYTTSQRYYLRFLKIRTNHLRYDPDLATTYFNIGELYYTIGELLKNEQNRLPPDERSPDVYMHYLKKSIYHYGLCLHISRNIVDKYDPVLATTYHSLAASYISIGDYQASEGCYLACVNIRESSQPRNDVDLAQIYRSLGDLYYYMRRYGDSLDNYHKLLEIRKNEQQNNSLDLAQIYETIGRLYHYTNDYPNSERYFLESLKIRESMLHQNHQDRYSIYKCLWKLYESMGNPDRSKEYYLKCLKIKEYILLPTHNKRVKTYIQLRNYYYNQQEYVIGARYHFEHLRLKEILQLKNQEPYDPNYYDQEYIKLGLYFRKIRDYSNSIECYLRCLDIRAKHLGEHHPDLAPIYKDLGILYYNKGNYKRSIEHISQFLNIHQTIQPADPRELAQIYEVLSFIYSSYQYQDHQRANYYSMMSQQVLSTSRIIDDYSYEVYGREFELEITPKLKNIVSDSISSLSEESKYILKIVCLGDCDNIPYEILYTVYSYSYPHTTQEDFNQHLSEITRLSILTYDSIKGIYKIFRVIQQAAILQLSQSINDSLIQHYSDYLYNNYNPKPDIYTTEETDLIKNLTFHAAKYLTQYKNKDLSARDILNYSKLAFSYSRFFSDEESARKYLKLVEESSKDQIPADSDLAQAYINLGDSYQSLKEPRRSEECYLRCLALREAGIPVEILAKRFNSLGDFYFNLGDYTRSEENYLQSLHIRESILPSNHTDLAITYNGLGNLYLRMVDHRRSEEYYMRCLRIRESNFPDNKLDLAMIYNNLAELYRSIGAYNRSEDYYLRCLEIRRSALPGDHVEIAQIYNNLGRLYRDMGDYARSEEHFLECLEIMENNLPLNETEISQLYASLGELNLSNRNYGRSEYFYSTCLMKMETSLHENHPDLANLYRTLGDLYRNMGDNARSEEYYLRCLKIWRAILPGNHPDLANLYRTLGDLYRNIGDNAKSEEYYLRCLKIWRAILPGNHPDLADLYRTLGDLYRNIGDYAMSEEYYLRCLKIWRAILPGNHSELDKTYCDILSLYQQDLQ